MIISAVRIENFKALKRVQIRPNPTLVIITGANAQGKSSVLDAIEAAIGGKTSAPARPIRNGEDRAEVRVSLGDLVVTRRWTSGSDSRLFIENSDGSRPRSPQTLLSSLFTRVAIDPFDFTRWKSSQQAAVLRQVAGIDADLAALDADAEALRAERQEVTRAVKSDEGALNNYPPEEELAVVPDCEPMLSGLMDLYRNAVDEKRENDQIREGLERSRRLLETKREAMLAAHAKFQKLSEEVAAAAGSVVETEEMVSELRDPDVAALQAEINEADSVAKRVRVKKARQEVYERWVQNREHSAGLTSQIEAIQAEKEARLSEARFPIEGLDVRGDEVRLNGVPLDQASSAQKIRLGLAVGAALNPSLRVALIRDGSLLDDAALAEVETWATDNHFQIWLEKVGSPESANGIVIEAGEVVADRQGGKLKGFEATKQQAAELF